MNETPTGEAMQDAQDSVNDPAWQHYPETILHFEDGPAIDLRNVVTPRAVAQLRALGLTGSFAIITAHNPRGRTIAPGQNTERHAALLRRVNAITTAYEVTGASPDRTHQERSVAAALSQQDARQIARDFEQTAIFWFDGARFWIVGALPAIAPVPLPR